MEKRIVLFVVSVVGGVLLHNQVTAQVVLDGSSYSQNFNSVGAGLPPGWSVWTNATDASLGAVASFETNATSWADSAGEFRNCASVTNNSGILATNAGSGTQHTFTNRVLAVRQGSSFGDPGAAFVFQILNTTGLSNLQFSVDFMMLDDEGRDTVWTVDYGIGSAPGSFTVLGAYTNSGTPGTISRPTYELGSEVSDQSDVVTLRIAALDDSTGSGSRDTFGLDNFLLSFNGATAPSIPLNIDLIGGNVTLTWSDPAFILQSASNISGPYNDVISSGPTHHECDPATNAFTDQMYFRLVK